uniref:Tetraspanin n=2 Tax=Opuntia streptacantha TaxID=393608 RepID=A0A7C9D7C2_OPUST
MRVSNNLVGLLNFLTFLLSIPILGGGIWLAHRATTDCEKYLERPVIALGVFLMLVSLAGLIGACCRVNWLLWLYLLVMFILILILFCFTIFAFVVTNKGAGEALGGKGYKEYKLGDYSNWLQKRVTNNKNWNRIRSCLIDGKVCESLSKENSTTQSQFFAKHLSPIQSGCCKPPDSCGFTYQGPISWSKPPTPAANASQDCNAWGNDATILCYNCDSCKAGVLQNIKSDWKKVAILNIIFLVILIIVYSVGCCAFRNNRWDNANNRWKPYA